jgi:hypothetical protein
LNDNTSLIDGLLAVEEVAAVFLRVPLFAALLVDIESFLPPTVAFRTLFQLTY